MRTAFSSCHNFRAGRVWEILVEKLTKTVLLLIVIELFIYSLLSSGIVSRFDRLWSNFIEVKGVNFDLKKVGDFVSFLTFLSQGPF